jgi:hypothetical protein
LLLVSSRCTEAREPTRPSMLSSFRPEAAFLAPFDPEQGYQPRALYIISYYFILYYIWYIYFMIPGAVRP